VLLSSYGACWMDYEIMKAVVSWRERSDAYLDTHLRGYLSQYHFKTHTPTMIRVQINQRSMMVQINFMHDLTTIETRGLINFIKVPISPSIHPSYTITPSKF